VRHQLGALLLKLTAARREGHRDDLVKHRPRTRLFGLGSAAAQHKTAEAAAIDGSSWIREARRREVERVGV
jgi:hypothetical protein